MRTSDRRSLSAWAGFAIAAVLVSLATPGKAQTPPPGAPEAPAIEVPPPGQPVQPAEPPPASKDGLVSEMPAPQPPGPMEDAQLAWQRGDKSTAFQLWKTEAERNNPEAMWLMGNMYASGDGVRQDLKLAAELYAKAAELNHAESLVSLATLYRTGQGVSQNVGQAAALLYKAAEVEHPIALYDLGQMFLTGEDGNVTEDPWHARQWFRLAAKRGVIMAQYKLAEMYFADTGITPSDVDNDVIGFIWLEQAYRQASEDRENYWSSRVFPLSRVFANDKDQRTFKQVVLDRYQQMTTKLTEEKINQARRIVETGDIAKL